MIFFLNLIYSILVSYSFGKKFNNKTISSGGGFILFLHILVIWLIISGGQYYVGTDYPTYIHLFNGNGLDYYIGKGELLFYFVIRVCNELGLYGQVLYYIFYSINFIILYLILKRINISYYYIFILLYIGYTNIFNNELNILRQAVAIHICTYACILYCEQKYFKSLLIMCAAIFMHVSTIIMLVIYFSSYIFRMNTRNLKIILCISLASSFLLNLNTFSFLTNYLPPSYAAHLQNETNERSIATLITKYIYIPFIWQSLQILKEDSLSIFQKKVFYLGYIGFCIRIALIQLPIISRMADNFLILSIFPLYYYIKLHKNKQRVICISLCLIILLFYAIKTLFIPKAEYLYSSIYFKI